MPRGKGGTRTVFQKPTLKEVREYIQVMQYQVNAEAWFAHYESNGWKVGKNPMKDWRASVRYWQYNGKGGKHIIDGGRTAPDRSEKWSSQDIVIRYGNEKPSG